MHEFGVLFASLGDVRVGGVVLSVWWWRLGLLLCGSVVCGWCGGVAWSLVCGVVGWEGLPPAVYWWRSECGSGFWVGSVRYFSRHKDQSVIFPVMMYLRCSRESW